MWDIFFNAASNLDAFLWGPWTMCFIAFVSIFLTFKSRFFQLSNFRYIFSETFLKVFQRSDIREKNTISPFQATSTSLAGTVGMGNMAGVATALSIGGPGAIFWMWVLALFGMITKAAEITLAIHYREVDDNGDIFGGPMLYIKKALGWRFLAILFSLGITINCIFTSSLLQAHTVGRALDASYNINPYLTTSLMAFVTMVVTIGGVRRIGKFCEALVPLMTLLYLGFGLIIFFANIESLPEVFMQILSYAFSPAPAVGGFAGASIMMAIQMGMARGMLSNEAGLGTAPMVHANAETKHPFQQGLWGAAEVFFDTTLVCTITAVVILSSGVLAGGNSGIELLLDGFSSYYSTATASIIISVAITTFCLSTQIGFFIYFKTALTELVGKKIFRIIKWIYFLPGIIFAGITNVDQLWQLANISVAVSAIPNLVALLFLSGVFINLMQDYISGKMKYETKLIDESKKYIKKS
ncbi:MAG: sodium:alanine symporter family protein [Gammaproteobacteria bacterium]|nr:MAG: sodium:alanine symporter family protein [Gammaproteobacteria bacterium]|tara:strand:- start:22721 stop:24127 length:1407 start_codon:yes stop_codon:yes gene_type:complete